MRTRRKLSSGAIIVILILAAAVSTASARRLEMSNQGIRATWTELTFTGLNEIARVICPVTIEGTLHSRTISKVSGQLIGFITRAALTRPCRGGEFFVLNGIEVLEGTTTRNSLPWHIRYDSFRGALPRIEGIRWQIIGFGWLLRFTILGSTVRCLYKSTAREPAFGILNIGEGGRVESLEAEEGRAIPKFEGEGACPANGNFRGRATVTLLGTTTVITVRLVA